MRILVTGFVLFVIWCFVSAWVYNDKLIPALKMPGPVQSIPESQTNLPDSLAKFKSLMPKDILIYFEFNSTKFNSDPQIDSNIAVFKSWLDKYPESMLSVTGHTDLVGTPDYNQILTLKRAEIVGKHLESLGVIPGRMSIESKGETEPAADYLTGDGRAKNRRTEISIKM
jgi:outer membrane protein OmpA-like peptidoglycan-associated protein